MEWTLQDSFKQHNSKHESLSKRWYFPLVLKVPLSKSQLYTDRAETLWMLTVYVAENNGLLNNRTILRVAFCPALYAWTGWAAANRGKNSFTEPNNKYMPVTDVLCWWNPVTSDFLCVGRIRLISLTMKNRYGISITKVQESSIMFYNKQSCKI